MKLGGVGLDTRRAKGKNREQTWSKYTVYMYAILKETLTSYLCVPY